MEGTDITPEELHPYPEIRPEYEVTVEELAADDDSKTLLTERKDDLLKKLEQAKNFAKDHGDQWKVDITRMARNIKDKEKA